MPMTNITVGRYKPATEPLPVGVHDVTEFWQGWIEPDDQTWIMFIAADGAPVVYLDRDPVTGGVR